MANNVYINIFLGFHNGLFAQFSLKKDWILFFFIMYIIKLSMSFSCPV